MARLPAVLGTDDLPLAELCAARIDGELMRIGDGWAPIDEPDLPALRAAAVAIRMPRRLVIERLSAAWVHGALAVAPSIAQFCVPHDSRIAVILDRRATVREVRIDDEEIVEFRGIRCTSIARTAFDLVRETSLDDDTVVGAVGAMAIAYPQLLSHLRDRLHAAGRIPHKSVAGARIERIGAAHGALSSMDAASRR